MKRAALIALAAAVFAACSYVEPYVGPEGPPVLSDIERRWPDVYGNYWRMETLLGITNRSRAQLDGTVDCDPDASHAHRFSGRHAMGSRFEVSVPPMSTKYVLLDKSDQLCRLLPAE